MVEEEDNDLSFSFLSQSGVGKVFVFPKRVMKGEVVEAREGARTVVLEPKAVLVNMYELEVRERTASSINSTMSGPPIEGRRVLILSRF